MKFSRIIDSFTKLSDIVFVTQSDQQARSCGHTMSEILGTEKPAEYPFY